jgi:hypothetical protein
MYIQGYGFFESAMYSIRLIPISVVSDSAHSNGNFSSDSIAVRYSAESESAAKDTELR